MASVESTGCQIGQVSLKNLVLPGISEGRLANIGGLLKRKYRRAAFLYEKALGADRCTPGGARGVSR